MKPQRKIAKARDADDVVDLVTKFLHGRMCGTITIDKSNADTWVCLTPATTDAGDDD